MAGSQRLDLGFVLIKRGRTELALNHKDVFAPGLEIDKEAGLGSVLLRPRRHDRPARFVKQQPRLRVDRAGNHDFDVEGLAHLDFARQNQFVHPNFVFDLVPDRIHVDGDALGGGVLRCFVSVAHVFIAVGEQDDPFARVAREGRRGQLDGFADVRVIAVDKGVNPADFKRLVRGRILDGNVMAEDDQADLVPFLALLGLLFHVIEQFALRGAVSGNARRVIQDVIHNQVIAGALALKFRRGAHQQAHDHQAQQDDEHVRPPAQASQAAAAHPPKPRQADAQQERRGPHEMNVLAGDKYPADRAHGRGQQRGGDELQNAIGACSLPVHSDPGGSASTYCFLTARTSGCITKCWMR